MRLITYMPGLILPLACLLVATSTHQVFARSCPPQSESPETVLNFNKGRVVMKTRHGRSDLMRIHRNQLKRPLPKNWRPLGLTLTDFRFSIRTAVKATTNGDGRFCVYPDRFDIDIGFSDFIVYIDRQYPKGSCEYRAIREHEDTHVSLYRSHLSRHEKNLKRTIKDTAASIKPIIVRSPNQGARQIQRKMQTRISPIIKRLNRQADDANARIDTRESYRDVQALCDNW